MSFFNNIASWFNHSPAVSGVKKEAIEAVTESFAAALKEASTHAPDMKSSVEAALAQGLQAAVAGIMTRTR